MTDSSIVVLGLGNIIMSDEGVGVHVIQRLLDGRRLPPTARLVDGGTLGLELLSITSGASLLIVIDAIDLDLRPGSIVRLETQELFGMDRGASVHQLGVADLLSALGMLGAEPEKVLLFGVQPGRLELGTALSPEVAGAVDQVAEQVLEAAAAWYALGGALCMK